MVAGLCVIARRMVYLSPTHIMLAFVAAGFYPLPAEAVEDGDPAAQYQLVSRLAPGDVVRVDAKLEVGGHLKFSGKGKIERVEMSVVAEMGYDRAFGARPLKRLIQQRIENTLARKILNGEIEEDTRVTIDARGKSFMFETE